MTEEENSKMSSKMKLFLSRGFFLILILVIAFSISCQASPPAPAQSEEIAPPQVPAEEETAPAPEVTTPPPAEEEVPPPPLAEEEVTTPPPVEEETKPPVPGGEGTTPGSTPAPTSFEIRISGFAFAPETVTVARGATVTWTNQDSAPHTVTSETDLFGSSSLGRNASFSHSFTESGTFGYFCAIHPSMRGTVIVE